MLEVGERAPEFTLPDDTGKDRSLTGLLNSGATVLYFFGADFTVGSAHLACALRDLQRDMQAAGIGTLGISPQSPRSHARFRAKFRLPFTLLSDEYKAVVKMYGVNGRLGIGVRRATFLIDRSCRIRDAVVADFKIERHVEFVRKAIARRTTMA